MHIFNVRAVNLQKTCRNLQKNPHIFAGKSAEKSAEIFDFSEYLQKYAENFAEKPARKSVEWLPWSH